MSAKPPTARRAGKRQEQRIFQYDDYWLGYEDGTDIIYIYWYDEKSRRTRRNTSGTRDLEEAKLRLIQRVLETPKKGGPAHPDTVHLVTVLKFYMKHHGDKIRSGHLAKRAFELLARYLKASIDEGAPTVGQFTLARQHAFMKWCRDEHNLSAKSISTYLSYIKAAFRFASTPRVIKDDRGAEREVCIMSAAVHVVDSEEVVSKITDLPRSQPRQWVPDDRELAAMIDEIQDEHVFRYVIMALNTWARPEAIIELDIPKQVDFQHGLVDLNPPGRTQNKKRRPTIRLTESLRDWLIHWNLDRPIVFNGMPVQHVDNRTLAKAAKRAGITNSFTKYTIRHYMATRIRKVPGILVSREERAEWMGHADPEHRMTQWYESFDPDYLESCMRATDAIMRHLDQLCRRSLIAPNVEHVGRFTVISQGESQSDGKKVAG